MKTIAFILTAALNFFLVLTPFCQTDQENIDKYWAYRDRLRKDFLKIGNLDGESIPMTSRRIDWAFQNQNNSPWPNASAVYFSDATIYLAQFFVSLAMQHKL